MALMAEGDERIGEVSLEMPKVAQEMVARVVIALMAILIGVLGQIDLVKTEIG